ncbi:YSIRK-type signal peptide-containing protein [Streptococcus pneumoniae]|nr:YSIRK-type signal peptide-containing protein [Streptococcus pneumoniae]
MSKSNHERRMRYSIRKFSVGVASVAVASLFMGSVVHATENVSANPPIPQIVSPGDKKEYEDAVQRVNKEISDYVTSRLDSLDRSVSGFSEIVTKVQVVVDKYRDKIDRVSTKSMVEELGREVKKKVDEEIKLFQNRSGSKSTPKGFSLNDGLQGGGGDPSVGQGPGVVPQPGGQAGGSMVVPPVTQTPPSTSPSPGQKATEAEKKKLQDLIRQGQEELKKLEDYLREVNNYPELPDNDPDYKVQKKDIWDNSKDTAPKKIQVFKEQLEKQTYTEKTLKDAVAEFIYYQFHAQIETMTRKIATYRKKHPNVAEVERLFSEKLKQTANSTYATLEGEALKTYFERDFLPVFNKIHSIIEELEKKSSQGELKKQDKVAEAQKKVEEAEKKAKAQKEEDRRNYPTNTSKTIELEIAEAQVEVAKAELELAQAQAQTPQDTDKINTAKAKVETAKSKVKTLEKIKSDSGRAQAGDQKPSMPAPDTKPDLQPQPEVPSTSPEPKPIPQPDGKQPSTPKEPENKKPSVPTQEKPIPQPEKPKPEVKPQPETPKTSKIITASDGKTKVTVVFDKAVDADKVNIKEVTTKELAEKIARQTGGGTVRIFDLSLSKGGKETHVNGERTVRLALGQTASDVHVYHVKENGDLERIPSKVENGQVVFKTNHFSLFAIKTLSKNQNVTTPKQIKPSVQHGQTQIGENQTGKFQNKEVNHKPLATGNETMAKENPTSATEKNLPSTGAATNLVLEIIGLLGLAGTSLIAMKRRK